jgi:large subunit ribosomal protein L1
MSKTSQENKVKKAQQKLDVEVQTEIVEQKAVEETPAEVSAEVQDTADHKVKTAKVRGKKYLAAKKKIDVTKYYPLEEAVKLVKETSLSKFDGKIEAHVTVIDLGNIGEISFPHLETASKKIVVLNDTILAEIKDGKINFDILIATPSTMPKLLPFAKLLGPKGLMPNPKIGTLTDKPEEAVKKLSVAKLMLKTEKKNPVVHIVVGKVYQPVEELAANINELIKVIKTNKIKKLALCATMGPCVKVKIA